MSHPRLHRYVVPVFALAALVCGVNPAAARGLRIKRVAFSGTRTVSLAALRVAVAPILPKGRLVAARRRVLARRVQGRLQRTLRELGYHRATVQVTEHQPGVHTSFVVLRARVREGSRFRIGALDVTGVGPALRLKTLSRVLLRSGQFFGAGDLRRSASSVATVLADRGHAFVRIKVRQTPHKSRPLVDVTFQVRAGPVVKVGRVVIQGASTTATRLVRRALLLRPGSRYHRTTLVNALARLRRTGAFKSLKLTESPLSKKSVKLLVTVVQAKP